ncbi:MAG: HD domain-containing phosphohydrolase [Bradymonadaceae bacterium]
MRTDEESETADETEESSPRDETSDSDLVLSLSVASGPDAGMSLSFRQDRVTVGRSPENDFVLSDGFVSSDHGEFVLEDDGYVYRDLESRHGSLIVMGDVSERLHGDGPLESDAVGDGCEVQVGCSLLEVELASADDSETDVEWSDTSQSLSGREFDSTSTDVDSRDKVITQALRPVQSLDRRFDTDSERLAILFRLAGELNGLTELDEILDLVVEATFDAFPNANFFAITLASTPEEVDQQEPFFTRVRGDVPGDDLEGEPILSTSILEHVVESEESVLFLKNSVGAEVTESILKAGITSCLCAPLAGQEKLLGVMEVDTRGQGGVFSRRDLDLFSVLASNTAFAIERAQLSSNIVEMFNSFVAASVDAIEARDPATAGHSERVTSYTLDLARAVNATDSGAFANVTLGDSELKELRYATLLHDFGKIAVDEAVLQKGSRLEPTEVDLIAERMESIAGLDYRRRVQEATEEGDLSAETFDQIDREHRQFAADLREAVEKIRSLSEARSLTDEQIEWVEEFGARTYRDAEGEERPYLTDSEVESLTIQYGTLDNEEWKLIKSHPRHSEEILERIAWSDELERIPQLAGAHHEKLDGSGYPKGRTGDSIPIQVRIMTIADIFDALTASDRPYRDAFSVETAIDILEEEAAEGKLDADLVELFVERVLPEVRDRVPN